MFAAEAPNELWLADITSSGTRSTRGSKSRLAVQTLENAVAVHGDGVGCVVHSDKGSQFSQCKFLRLLARHRNRREHERVGLSGVTLRWRASSCCRTMSSSAARGSPGSNCDRDGDLDLSCVALVPRGVEDMVGFVGDGWCGF